MDIRTYTFDNFKYLCKMLPKPTDYFDFPSSMMAFGLSLGSSQLVSIDDVAYFRCRGIYLTLITYYCTADELKCIIKGLMEAGYKIKFLNCVNKDMSGWVTSSYGNEYYIDHNWNIQDVIDNSVREVSYKLRTAIKRGDRDYDVVRDFIPKQDVLDLFEKWYSAAKKRHFMVVRGHYLAYIDMYYKSPNNVIMVGFRNKVTGELSGIAGYEIYKNNIQMTLGKHLIGDYYFPRYFWISIIQDMISKGCNKLFLGSTADDLKTQLGLSHYKSYKLIYKDNTHENH